MTIKLNLRLSIIQTLTLCVLSAIAPGIALPPASVQSCELRGK